MSQAHVALSRAACAPSVRETWLFWTVRLWDRRDSHSHKKARSLSPIPDARFQRRRTLFVLRGFWK